jgi:hypothetical protein
VVEIFRVALAKVEMDLGASRWHGDY